MAVLGVGMVGLILLAYTYLRYSGGQSGFNKMQLLQQSNRMTEYLKYIASFVFVYSFVSEGKYVRLSRIIGILLIAYTFFLGHRSFAVICLISVFLHILNKQNQSVRLISYIRKRWKLFLLLLVFLLFFMFVKNVFAAFITGQYDLVRQRLTDPDYYLNMLLNGESNVILMNLNRVCVADMQYSIANYFLSLIGLIPIIGNYALNLFEVDFFETKLNRLFNSRLNEGVGLGSTYLGEAYATGWYVFLIIALIGTFVLISYLQRKRDRVKSKLTYTWLSLMLVYFTFYIHRNSLIYLLVTMRAYLYILLLICLIRWVLTPFFSRSRRL